MADYKSLDVCLNILYDRVYNVEPENCYVVPPITKADIDINTLKRTNHSDWEQIMDSKFEYMGKFNNKYTFRRISKTSYPCTVSISIYNPKNLNLNDLNRGELINMAMLYILSELVIAENFPFVLLPLANFDMTREQLLEYPDISDKINTDANNYCVNVTEQYYNLVTLKEFFERNIKNMTIRDWRVLFFQVLFALYKISERLRKFRHNMLNLEAVKIYINKNRNINTFKVIDMTFELPDTDFEIKISDFDKSYTTDYIRNRDTNLISENPYYDIYYFFQNVIYAIEENNVLHTELNKFLFEMVPENLRVSKQDFNGLNETLFEQISSTILTPVIILRKNNFFSEFIKESRNNMDLSASPLENNSDYINKFANKESGVDYNEVSITDSSSDAPRLLAKNINYSGVINKSKKKTSYNNSRMNEFIHGSRKINDAKLTYTDSLVEGAINDDDDNDDDLFRRIEENYTKTSDQNADTNRNYSNNRSNRSNRSNKSNRNRNIKSTNDPNTANNNIKEEEKYYEAYDDIVDPTEIEDSYQMQRMRNDMQNDNTITEQPSERAPEVMFMNLFSNKGQLDRITPGKKLSYTGDPSDLSNYDNTYNNIVDDNSSSQNREQSEEPEDIDESYEEEREDKEDKDDLKELRKPRRKTNKTRREERQTSSDNESEMNLKGRNGQIPSEIMKQIPEGYAGELPERFKQMMALPDPRSMFNMQNGFKMPVPDYGGGMGMGQFPPNIGSAALPSTIPGLTQEQVQQPLVTQTTGSYMGLENIPQIPQIPQINPQQEMQNLSQVLNQGVQQFDQTMQNIPQMFNQGLQQMVPQNISQMVNPALQQMVPQNIPQMVNPGLQNIPQPAFPVMQGGSLNKKYKFKTDNFFF